MVECKYNLLAVAVHFEVYTKYNLCIVGLRVVGKERVAWKIVAVALIISLDVAWVVGCFGYFGVDHFCIVRNSVKYPFCVVFFDSRCVLNLRLVWVCSNFLILAFINYNWGGNNYFSLKWNRINIIIDYEFYLHMKKDHKKLTIFLYKTLNLKMQDKNIIKLWYLCSEIIIFCDEGQTSHYIDRSREEKHQNIMRWKK